VNNPSDGQNREYDGKLDDLGFLPVVGINYDEGFLGTGKKLLVLGESHYSKNKEADLKLGKTFTREQFGSFCEGNGPEEHMQRFVKAVNHILTGNADPSEEEIRKTWRSLAFANFVQLFVHLDPETLQDVSQSDDDSVSRPSAAHWEHANELLPQLLDALQPDRILVLGKVNWDMIRDKGDVNQEHRIWQVGSLQRSNGGFAERALYEFKHRGETAALATWVYHPSRSREALDLSHNVFVELME